MVAAALLQPQSGEGMTYTESFTSMALLQDGTFVVMGFMFSNLPFASGKGGCSLTVVRPGQPDWRAQSKVDAEHWYAAPSPVPTLMVGDCRMTASSTGLQVDVELEGTTALLHLDAPAKEVLPPSEPVRVEGRWYASSILVPFANAELTLAQPGKPVETLHGMGYADHSRSTALPPQLARGWIRFRGHSGRCGAVLQVRLPPGADSLGSGYLWQEGAAAPQALDNLKIGLPVADLPAARVQLSWQIEGATWSLRAQKRLRRSEPVRDAGFLGRLASHWVGDILNETFYATLEGPGSCGPVPGVLEVEHIKP